MEKETKEELLTLDCDWCGSTITEDEIYQWKDSIICKKCYGGKT